MIGKCIVMFSGGLDSRLVLKIMQERGYDATALYFKLPFSKDSEAEVKEFCKKQKTKLKILDCTKGKLLKDYLELIKKPKYGTGAGVNPCIDCKIFMLQKAREYADKNKIKIIASGEVLGQRPMSQHQKALGIIETESKLSKRLIRPLIEKGIRGRGRKKQIQMAGEFKITYPGPAGGCLLCEKSLIDRFKSLLKDNMINEKNLPLVSTGRHFINSKRWIVLGRNEKENKIIEKIKGIKIIPKQPGPIAWISNRKLIPKAEKLIKKHSKHEIRDFKIKNEKYVYEFTNQRKLTKREFIRWFQKKFLYIIRKFNMAGKGDVIAYENKRDFRGIVLKNLLKIFSRRADIEIFKLPSNKKFTKKAITSTTDTEADKIAQNLIKGKADKLKELAPVYNKTIKPLFLFLDKEVLLYAKLMNLKFKKPKEKKDKISNFIDDLEEKHPEIKNSIISSYLKLFP